MRCVCVINLKQNTIYLWKLVVAFKASHTLHSFRLNREREIRNMKRHRWFCFYISHVLAFVIWFLSLLFVLHCSRCCVFVQRICFLVIIFFSFSWYLAKYNYINVKKTSSTTSGGTNGRKKRHMFCSILFCFLCDFLSLFISYFSLCLFFLFVTLYWCNACTPQRYCDVEHHHTLVEYQIVTHTYIGWMRKNVEGVN